MRLDPSSRDLRADSLPRLTPEFIASLHDRPVRDRQGLFIAEGLRFFHSAQASGTPILGLALCPTLLPFHARCELREYAARHRVPVMEVPRGVFQALSVSSEPTGLLMVFRQTWSPLPQRIDRHDLWIGVEHLRTLGNLGTLMRSATAFGATGLMVFGPPRDRTDVFAAQAVRASMGGLFSLRVVQTSHHEFRRWNRRYEVTVLGACPEASMDVRRVSLRRPVVFMLGNERKGLSEAQRGTCDGFVRVPMAPGTDSMNVAMAGTVLLYEAASQRSGFGRRQ